MKPAQIALVLSLVANAACLAAFALSPAREKPITATPVAGRRETGPQAAAPTIAPGTASGSTGDLAALLRSDDIGKLAEALRNAGVPEDLVRAIVRERINARYVARLREIDAGSDAGSRPYWKPARNRLLTPEQREQRRQLQREMLDELNKFAGNRTNAGGASDRYAFLPEETRTQLDQVEADYRDMRTELQRSMQEFPLKSEQEAMRMLESERKRDIEALLTPEEREALELRTSPAASMIREQYGALLQSEDEFKQLYALQRDYEKLMTSGAVDPATRAAAQRDLQAQINAVLGPERVAALAQQRDPDVRMLQAAAAKLNLSESAITQSTLALRDQLSQESQRIAADPSLDNATRRQALTALATQARAQLQTILGADGGETFADRAGWINALNRGNAFTIRAEGGIQISRGARTAPVTAP